MVDSLVPVTASPIPPAPPAPTGRRPPRPGRSKPAKTSQTELFETAVNRLAKRTHIAAHSDDARSIHKVRVATRKLGTVLRSYEPLVSNKTQSKIKKALKKIRRSGGAVRDIDVAVEVLDGLSTSLLGEPLLLLYYYRGRLEEQRNIAQKGFKERCEKVDSERFWDWCQRHLKADVLKNSRNAQIEERLVTESLREAYDSTCDLRDKHVQAPDDIELLHELRKALKGLRYTVDMVPPRRLPAKVLQRADKIAQEAQDRLGAVIDVYNTIHLVGQIHSEMPVNRTLLDNHRDTVLVTLGSELAIRHADLAEGWAGSFDLAFLGKVLPPTAEKPPTSH